MLNPFGREALRASRHRAQTHRRDDSRRTGRVPVALWILALLGATAAAMLDGQRRNASATLGTLAPRRPFAVSSTVSPGDGTPTDRMRVVLVARRSDCAGNLGIAGLLGRRRIAAGLRGAELLIEGTASDTLGIRGLLPRTMRDATISLLDDRERRTLQVLGHRRTPLLLLFDHADRLLLAIPVTPDPVAQQSLVRALTHVVDADPRT